MIVAAAALLCCTLVSANEPEWCKKLSDRGNQKLERVLPEEPWFEIYRVQPDVYALSEPRQYEEVISYLMVGSKRAILLDTGMGIGSTVKLWSG